MVLDMVLDMVLVLVLLPYFSNWTKYGRWVEGKGRENCEIY